MSSTSAAPEGVKGLAVAAAVNPAARSQRVGIVYTQWNPRVINALVGAVVDELLRNGLEQDRIHLLQVPGAFELPFAAERLQQECTVVLCIGCLIKGETLHFEYISEAVAQGIMRLNSAGPVPSGAAQGSAAPSWRAPVIYGVLECLTEAQALARAGLVPGSHNHGTEWAQSALRMAEIHTTSRASALALQTVEGFRAALPQAAAEGSK